MTLFVWFEAVLADCSSPSLKPNVTSLSCQLSDSNNNDKDERTADDQCGRDIITSTCERDITDRERCEAMVAAMDVYGVESVTASDQRSGGGAMSVEACLARFTEKETLCGTNMITCERCSRDVAGADDDDIESAVHNANQSASSSNTNHTGMCRRPYEPTVISASISPSSPAPCTVR